MNDIASAIEWYLARDGQQYGPLNDDEMRAFVNLGHLKANDLIWRVGFADWRAASEVFAIAPPVMAPVAPPQPPPDPAPPAPFVVAAPPAPAEPAAQYGAVQSGYPASPQVAATLGETHEFQARLSGIAGTAPMAAAAEPQLLTPDQLFAPAPPPAATEQTQQAPSLNVSARPQQRPQAGAQGARQVRRPGPAERRDLARHDQRRSDDDEFGDEDDDRRVKRRFGIARLALAVVVAVALAAGATLLLSGDRLNTLISLASPLVAAGGATSSTPAASQDGVDAAFQRSAVWRQVKEQFPEWYAERLADAAKLAAEKRGDAAIAKHLAESLVVLRRKHVDEALTASPERLKFVATTFLENLQSLAQKDVGACYGFISQGDTHPAVLALVQQSEGASVLQRQTIAIFDAIADGRKAPQQYLPPRKSDYDALAAALNARGWTEDDLRTFSDRHALGQAAPERVCRMVQDWFAAQIALPDTASQLRLLVQSLRPVFEG